MNIKEKLENMNKTKWIIHGFYLSFATLLVLAFIVVNSELAYCKARLSILEAVFSQMHPDIKLPVIDNVLLEKFSLPTIVTDNSKK